MIVKREWTQSNGKQNIEQLQNPTTMNQQQQNHRLRTDSSLGHRVGLNAFLWYQIFAIDSAVGEVQTC